MMAAARPSNGPASGASRHSSVDATTSVINSATMPVGNGDSMATRYARDRPGTSTERLIRLGAPRRSAVESGIRQKLMTIRSRREPGYGDSPSRFLRLRADAVLRFSNV